MHVTATVPPPFEEIVKVDGTGRESPARQPGVAKGILGPKNEPRLYSKLCHLRSGLVHRTGSILGGVPSREAYATRPHPFARGLASAPQPFSGLPLAVHVFAYAFEGFGMYQITGSKFISQKKCSGNLADKLFFLDEVLES